MTTIGIEGSLRPPLSLDLKGSKDLHAGWKNWKKSFLNYLEAAGLTATTVTDKRRVAILINLLGDDAMEIFSTFTYAEGKKAEVLNDVLEKFEEFCLPIVNVTMERFNFFQIEQKESENFESFVTNLRTAANTCQFEQQKESLIRDRIICGIRDSSLQRRLLRESDITLEKVINMGRVHEVSERQMKQMQESIEVNAIIKRNKMGMRNDGREASAGTQQKFDCRYCGFMHGPRNCPAYGQTCNKCNG